MGLPPFPCPPQVVDVACGSDHVVCLLAAKPAVVGWGSNSHGQLGPRSRARWDAPQAIAPAAGKAVNAVFAGGLWTALAHRIGVFPYATVMPAHAWTTVPCMVCRVVKIPRRD